MIGCLFLIYGRKEERDSNAYLNEIKEGGKLIEKLKIFDKDNVSPKALTEFQEDWHGQGGVGGLSMLFIMGETDEETIKASEPLTYALYKWL